MIRVSVGELTEQKKCSKVLSTVYFPHSCLLLWRQKFEAAQSECENCLQTGSLLWCGCAAC